MSPRYVNPITAKARLAVVRQRIRIAGIKHAAVAHHAGMHSGMFSFIWNGKRNLTDGAWRRVRNAIDELTVN